MMPEQILAEATTFVPGRRVDDNIQILLRYGNGARGALWASQVAPGNDNALRLRVFGEKGGLDWRQEEPNVSTWSPLGDAPRAIRRGTGVVNAAGQRVNRIPSGHPEGYLEAFADHLQRSGCFHHRPTLCCVPRSALTFPTIEDGFAGVAMVAAAIQSSSAGGVWVPVES